MTFPSLDKESKEVFNISLSDLKGEYAKREVVAALQVCFYSCL
jgi:chromosomal replication initiation ATPase DnaA